MTIISLFIAYTVPRQWSKILQREREKQTIFVMKQYTRAIREWSGKHGGAIPASIDQLKEARLPRVIRGPKGEYVDPLTGKVDWILVPPTAFSMAGNFGGVGGWVPPNMVGKQIFNPQASPKGYVGPFIGVRVPVSGQAMLMFRDSDQYDQWVYTTNDLKVDFDNLTKVNPNP
jgi:type II secretory pathway pseudopilin PulG